MWSARATARSSHTLDFGSFAGWLLMTDDGRHSAEGAAWSRESPGSSSTERDAGRLPRWLWNGTLAEIGLALAAALALIGALALGWNDPRLGRPPDWEAPGLPVRLEAAADDDAVSLLGHPGGDFTFEVIAHPLSGPDFNGYGLAYRVQDLEHYDVFAIGGDGYYAVLRVAGDREAIQIDWQQFPHIRRGRQANRLRVTCAGTTCRFYINDEYATTVEDDTRLTGDVGFWVCGFDEGVKVEFQEARLWKEG